MASSEPPASTGGGGRRLLPPLTREARYQVSASNRLFVTRKVQTQDDFQTLMATLITARSTTKTSGHHRYHAPINNIVTMKKLLLHVWNCGRLPCCPTKRSRRRRV